MTERRNADLFEILISQIRQNGKGNVVLGKAVSVLSETKLLEPFHDHTTCANSLCALGRAACLAAPFGQHLPGPQEAGSEDGKTEPRYSPIGAIKPISGIQRTISTTQLPLLLPSELLPP